MPAQNIHLMLNHVPLMGILFGFLLMIYYTFSKKEDVKKIAYFSFVISALLMLPTFFSGTGSEEIVEHLPNVSESLIEKHEDLAKLASALTYILGIFSIIALFIKSSDKIKKNISVSIFLLSILTTGLIFQTAHIGGQIRHSEIRSDFVNSSIEKDDKDED